LKKKKIGNKKKNLTQQEEKKKQHKDRSQSFAFFCCVRLYWWRLLRARFTLWAHTVNVLYFFYFFLKAADLFVELFFLSRRTRGSRDGRLYTTARCLQLIALRAFAYLITSRSRAPCPQRSLNATSL
jgi:hypothetical protein